MELKICRMVCVRIKNVKKTLSSTFSPRRKQNRKFSFQISNSYSQNQGGK